MHTQADATRFATLATYFSMLLAVALVSCAPNPLSECSNELCVAKFWGNANLTDAKLALDTGVRLDTPVHGNPPLTWVARGNPDPSVALLLLEAGAKINQTGTQSWEDNTALSEALRQNENPAMAELLLDRGAHIAPGNEFGDTPLHYAAANKNPNIAMLVLHRGADANAHSPAYGYRPINGAVNSSNLLTAKILVQSGATVDHVTYKGETLLHYAANGSNHQMVRWLLSIGLDPYVRNHEGQSACDLIQTNLLWTLDNSASVLKELANSSDQRFRALHPTVEADVASQIHSQRQMEGLLCR